MPHRIRFIAGEQRHPAAHYCEITLQFRVNVQLHFAVQMPFGNCSCTTHMQRSAHVHRTYTHTSVSTVHMELINVVVYELIRGFWTKINKFYCSDLDFSSTAEQGLSNPRAVSYESIGVCLCMLAARPPHIWVYIGWMNALPSSKEPLAAPGISTRSGMLFAGVAAAHSMSRSKYWFVD